MPQNVTVPPFVHLHLHSEFSLADGMVRIGPLVERLVELEMPAVALTDLANLYGAVKFYRSCLGQGIKPLLGAEVWVQSPFDPSQTDRLLLLCQNNKGYRALCRLLTTAYLHGQQLGRATIPAASLAQESRFLLALLCAEDALVCGALTTGKEEDAERLLLHYQQIFDDRLYLELVRVGRPHEEIYIDRALAVAASCSLPVVASNRVQFLYADNYHAHEIRVCINEGRVLEDSRRPKLFTEQQYLRSSEEMAALFEDIPEALENAREIARRCNAFLRFDRHFLPNYPDLNEQPVESLLRTQTEQGLCQRLGVDRLLDDQGRETVDPNYVVRMNLELDVIVEMGFPGYFLIVADFIRWARTQHIPVGPGRGSGAGSVVAWALGITELDPLKFGLLFERFLNPERVSLPDFDIDFCMEGRDRVIEYVAERYGREQVAQIITFGTMAARAVVRDVGRVMGLSYSFVDTLAKLIPFEIGMTLENALKKEEVLQQRYQDEPEVTELIDNARLLEGLARNAGKHAGGVVIAPQPLTEYTPLYAESAQSQAVTQFDKDDLEAVGLVKFDFLGLRTLTTIDRAVKSINAEREAAGEKLLEIDKLELDDSPTYDMIKAGRTTALFQMESRGMKEWIVKLKPDRFEDLVALVALYRPGPLGSGMVDDFVNCKHGRQRIQYPHPDLESILKETYGVILYQEQVMQIAQVLAGYSLGGADLLRRAMGKKKVEEMAKQRAIFMAGAEERTVDASTAEHIFDLMEKFAGYGFNKSHSAAYALIAYQTAWLKAHYPAAFMAATMTLDMEHTDKIVVLISECRDLQLEVLPPDINLCHYEFTPLHRSAILYGLGAVKGAGQAAINAIVEERERQGKFTNLFDFCTRVHSLKVNKRVIEALIKCGAMDPLGKHRAGLLAELPVAMVAAEQQQSNAISGQSDLFGIEQAPPQQPAVAKVADWSDNQRLLAEKETLGLYLTGHPLESYTEELSPLVDQDLGSRTLQPGQTGVVAGLIVGLRVLNTKRGERMAFVTLDDNRSRMEVSVFADCYSRYRELLRKDNIVIAQGELSADEFTGGCQMRLATLYDVEGLRQHFLRGIEFSLIGSDLDTGKISRLQEALQRWRGGDTQIAVHYRTNSGESGKVQFDDSWKVRPDGALIEALRRLFGDENIRFIYDVQALRNPPEALVGKQRRSSFTAAPRAAF